MIIDLLNYLPKEIIPRRGPIKKLESSLDKNKIVLKCRLCKYLILNRYLEITEKDLIAIGLYLAEGQKYINLERKTHHSGEIAISYSDLEGLELFCQLLEKLGAHRKELKIYINLNINLKGKRSDEELISYWLTSLNLSSNSLRPNFKIQYAGEKGKEIRTCTGEFGCLIIAFASVIFRSFFLNFIYKIFREILINKDKEKIVLILKGFFAGDGHVEFSQNPRRKGIYFSNKDPGLIDLLVKSLELIGVSSYWFTKPESTKTNSKSLIISKYSDMKLIIDLKITDFLAYKKIKARELINSYIITNGRFKNKLKINVAGQI